MGGEGQAGGREDGAKRNPDVSTSGTAAATHAAAGDAQEERGRKFTVAPVSDEIRAVVIPYSTVAAHGGDWQKVHNAEYMDGLIAQQEEGSNYGIRLRQQLIVDGIETGVNQIVIDKSDEERGPNYPYP